MDAFFRAYYPYIIFALNGVFLLGGLAITGKLMTRKDCDKCRNSCAETNKRRDEDVAVLGMRITRNEDKLNNLPTDEEVSELTIAMTALSGDVKVLAERIEGVRELQKSTKELATRVDNFIRHQKG